MYYPREAEKDHLYNRVILLIIACCVMLVLAAMARSSGLIYAAIKTGAVEVNATVTQVEDISRTSDMKLIHYRYVDQNEQTHEDAYVRDWPEKSESYEVGQTVPVLYSRWFPSKNSFSGKLNSHRPGFFIMTGCLSLALLTLLISLWTIRRIGILKAEDRYY
ncbi:DUF3592 domain-containing protein [Pseudomonas viridiflava]|uniref:DUF3592 domain-containing protein n=1 Tax=Pseudomonas viridiflava TaxID=33069 RepID=UPI000F0624B9|nr:DUF3592 domain-containing protein [Pseudomonas viridiflava]